ncbi:MAG TPA: hypothetical protein HA260_00485 [Thermoplasmata archaeon]|nr:hypothetical protein [Thermoplasmata archaeon]
MIQEILFRTGTMLICLLLIMPVTAVKLDLNNQQQNILEDYDPLVDINITVDILAIRALDTIDLFSDPDFFVTLFINDAEYTSPLWENTRYLYHCFTVTADVPDDTKTVNVTIQLWDADEDENTLCDISKSPNTDDSGRDIHLLYDVSIGRWSGDNNPVDITGCGRVCGSADGSIETNENDCELWFDIHQNDFDHDGLPYWIETNVYGTDPTVDDTDSDNDADGVPIEWEHRFGFNPLIWENHPAMDPDRDSLNNREEYLTYDFGSDPYRKDVFLEIDYMAEEDGTIRNVTNNTLELAQNPFHNRNIIFHFDTGELNGGEIVPHDTETKFEELRAIWNTYFLHNDSDDWRRGVFHYLIFVHDQTPKGFAFSGDVSPYWGYNPGTDAFALANTLVEKRSQKMPLKTTDYIVASLIVHEMGHNFGIRFGEPFGCDNRLGNSPFKIGWYIWRNYRSIMNYRYTYSILDYSDGSHGKRDYDDWENIDLSYFEIP